MTRSYTEDLSERPRDAETASPLSSLPEPSPIDAGIVRDGRVEFPQWRGAADTPAPQSSSPLPPDRRVGFAVIGLGRLSLEQILPAFQTAKRARLTALVSGSPEKLAVVGAQYGVPAGRCYSYETFDLIRDDPSIEAVYIVLPNVLHRSFTERAAAAGKHVLTEKPMSVSVPDAEAMVVACDRAGVKLMVAYRIHFETYNRRVREMIAAGEIGRIVAFTGTNTQTVAKDGADQWRHKLAMAGGGALVDIGLYCLNTARYLIGEEPYEVSAVTYSPAGDARFAQVEETISFTMRFPGGTIATGLSSYGGRDDKTQRVNGSDAVIEMPNAYRYDGQRLAVTGRRGDATGRTELEFAPTNQFASQIDHFADCIAGGATPDTPGEEGVRDHRIMDALYASARLNRPVKLAPSGRAVADHGTQTVEKV